MSLSSSNAPKLANPSSDETGSGTVVANYAKKLQVVAGVSAQIAWPCPATAQHTTGLSSVQAL